MARLLFGKGAKRRTLKARKKRAEGRVVRSVRPECERRDGRCRLEGKTFHVAFGGDVVNMFTHQCEGPSQWSHLGKSKRARTRGMAPEKRHTTTGTCMLCRKAHDQYDGRRKPRLEMFEGPRGADGPLLWKQDGAAYAEPGWDTR